MEDCLFYKLINKIENKFWLALLNYETSKGMVKIDGQMLEEFQITDGVKQGGVLSPFLFNFYINELCKLYN